MAHLCVEAVDWSAFVGSICNMFKEYANSNDVTLNVNEGTDAEVWIDKRQMRKVVNNLISNALKHTPQGGNVNVTTECDGRQVILRVTDTGKGIAETDLAHVFDCFYQARDFESLTEMGTGIGLNLTQNIVQQHHGTISVDSVINEGTTFVVTLPLGKDHFKEDEIKVKKEDKKTEETVEDKVIQPQPDIVLEADAMPPVREMKGIEEATILIVEDNDDIRQLLMTVLSPYYRILTAVDGQEGLEVIRDEMPDIIISDVLMPNMSGIELCKIIKEDFAICHIPVVLLTARTAVEQELEGLKTGADDYITKPFNNELLISR